jgi:hypothetical protein
MGALGEEANDENVSLGMDSPTETDNMEGMEGCSGFLAPEITVAPAFGAWIKEHHQTQEWY